jgi:hypothetical protein
MVASPSPEWVQLRQVDGSWPFCAELVSYARGTDVPIESFACGLRFDLLD